MPLPIARTAKAGLGTFQDADIHTRRQRLAAPMLRGLTSLLMLAFFLASSSLNLPSAQGASIGKGGFGAVERVLSLAPSDWAPEEPGYFSVTTTHPVAEAWMAGARLDPQLTNYVWEHVDGDPYYYTWKFSGQPDGFADVRLVFEDGEEALLENAISFYAGRPVNDVHGRAIEIDVNDVVHGDSTYATSIEVIAFPGGAPRLSRPMDYWLRAVESGTLTVSLCAEEMYGVVLVNHNRDQFTYHQAKEYCGAGGGPGVVQVPLAACELTQIRVDNTFGDGGAFTIETSFEPDGVEVRTPPGNDEMDGAVELESGIGATVDFSCATASALPGWSYPTVDAWFVVNMAAAGRIYLYRHGGVDSYALYDAAMNLYTVSGFSPYEADTPAHADVPAPGRYLLSAAAWMMDGARHVYAAFPQSASVDGEGEIVVEEGEVPEGDPVEGEVGEGTLEGQEEGEPILEGEEGAAEGEGSVEGETLPEGEGELQGSRFHGADIDDDTIVELDELLRVIQFRNSQTFHCDASTEDGFAPGAGDQSCAPHTADYAPADWHLSLTEIVRIIQLYNAKGYVRCRSGEDGFCI